MNFPPFAPPARQPASGGKAGATIIPLVLAVAGLLGVMGGVAWLWLSPRPFDPGVLLGFAVACAIVAMLGLIYVVYANRTLAQARQELEQHRVELHTILPKLRETWDAAPLSIVLLDPHDPNVPVKIVVCNPRACEMYGYSREEMIGHSIDMLE
ncbi:MAG: barA 6, partial [Lacunisphaera sp.]|nr:barA 6 [Lacunisphaera sp.]